MSHQALREYLLAIVDRYLSASKLEKSKILYEAELVCKLSRKQIIRRLNGGVEILSKSASKKWSRHEKSEMRAEKRKPTEKIRGVPVGTSRVFAGRLTYSQASYRFSQ